MDTSAVRPLVSVVMIFLNAERFIQEAIQSVLSQNYSNWELLLVDDGSTDGSTRIALAAAQENPHKVRYLEHADHQNRGMSSSRNLGASRAHGEYLAFLDADDVWFPHALSAAVQILEERPAVGIVYGATEWWYSWTGRIEDQGRDLRDRVVEKFGRPESLAYPPELIRLFTIDPGAVPCLSAILVRRKLFLEVGGFEENFRGLFEDHTFYTKICLRSIVYVTGTCWSRYRQHPGSSHAVALREGQLEQARLEFINWKKAYLQNQGVGLDDQSGLNQNATADALKRTIEEQRAKIAELGRDKSWLEEQWTAWKKTAEERERSIQELKAWIEKLETSKSWLEKDRQYWKGISETRMKRISGIGLRVAESLLPRRKQVRTAATNGASWSLSDWPLKPISREWGYDRGIPIDRYYIEKFLEDHSKDVQGCVLEIGDNSYTLRHGGSRVEKSEVLNVAEDNPLTTIVADLAQASQLSANQFDCIILTQTLHLIYDLHSTLNTLHRILKPGGVLLVTFPGITRTSVSEWPGSWYWGLTSNSAKRLFEDVFQPSNVVVEAYGNVLTASAFLYGFSADELRREDLEYRDPEYDLLVTVRVRKDPATREERNDLETRHETSRSARSAQQRALILLYHRISSLKFDPWSLCVSPEHFEGYLRTIREWGTPFALDELVERVSAGTLPPNAVALTLDDGYADTLSQISPLLQKYEVPVTMFLPTAALAQGREFWWDDLERVFLQPGELRPTLELEINQQRFHWDLGDAAVYTQEEYDQNLSWRAWHPAPGPRHRLYTKLWELLHPLSPQAIRDVLDRILEWANLPPDARPTHRILTWEEVTVLKDDPWIEFGSHGLTHSSLASLPADVQASELRQSKASLEAIIGRPITSLSYPYGKPQDYSIQTAALAREAGYKLAVINSPGIIDRTVDSFYLPRCYVEDCEVEEFATKLVQWMEE